MKILPPPPPLDGALPTALRSLCYNFQRRAGIECHLVIQDKPLPEDLLGDTRLQCFRIVQECLANIEKHAEATETSVLVRSNNNGELVICVSDNGKGFSPPDRDSCQQLRAEGHYGLWSIYERAASISGTLTFDSEAGEGTMVTLQIPLHSEGK